MDAETVTAQAMDAAQDQELVTVTVLVMGAGLFLSMITITT